MTIYTVKPGDSLYSIARNFGVPVEEIVQRNQLKDSSVLVVGQSLIIPKKSEFKREIYVNGYAYPSISSTVLKQTLPYLTYISIFSYLVKEDGSLVGIPDDEIIKAARAGGVAPMMVITNIKEGQGFDSALASTILSSEQAQNTLIKNVISTLKAKNYYGLDVDFEYVYPSDREAYNSFLLKVKDAISPLGYTLTTAIAPKLSANQTGLLYTAHDYPVHGKIADHVIIMTYEWGYTYGPAMAVAPVDQVARVLQYAVSVIPPKKILMGMPNYGYNWTLPFVKGSAASSLSNTAALDLARTVNVQIKYDYKSQSPYFTYYDSNKKQHEVWFDDARSIAARLKLVDEYNLGGVSYWTINRFYLPNWIVLSSMYKIRKLI